MAVVEEDGRALTWAALDEEVSRIATGLGAAGVVGGHRVLLALGNRLELVTAYLGILRAQAVAVPVNPRSTASELARMVADSGARMALADETSVQAVREGVATVDAALAGVAGAMAVLDADQLARGPLRGPRSWSSTGCRTRGERAYADLRAAEPRPVPPLPDPEKLAVLLYTSGVTGRPRAAMLTHRALLANIEQVARVEPADDPRRRRHLDRAAAVPRLRAQRGPRRRRAARRDDRAAAEVRPGGHPRPGGRSGLHDAAGRAGRVPALARPARPA